MAEEFLPMVDTAQESPVESSSVCTVRTVCSTGSQTNWLLRLTVQLPRLIDFCGGTFVNFAECDEGSLDPARASMSEAMENSSITYRRLVAPIF